MFLKVRVLLIPQFKPLNREAVNWRTPRSVSSWFSRNCQGTVHKLVIPQRLLSQDSVLYNSEMVNARGSSEFLKFGEMLSKQVLKFGWPNGNATWISMVSIQSSRNDPSLCTIPRPPKLPGAISTNREKLNPWTSNKCASTNMLRWTSLNNSWVSQVMSSQSVVHVVFWLWPRLGRTPGQLLARTVGLLRFLEHESNGFPTVSQEKSIQSV